MNALMRSIHSEIIRIGGARGSLVRATLPLGLILPMVITLVIGVIAESLHANGGLIQVREVSTTNSIYWVIDLGVTVQVVSAAYAQASVSRRSIGELSRHLLPQQIPAILGRWVVSGAIGAVCTFLATLMMLVTLPALFPEVYSQVSAASPEGVRFLWAVPLYCFAACGIGTGVGALIGAPAASVAVLTLWSLFLENALIYVPKGADLIDWMPFLNGIYGTGQNIALEPAWGPNGGLLYVVLVAAVILGAGVVKQSRLR